MSRSKRFPSFVVVGALALSLVVLALAFWQHERSSRTHVAQVNAPLNAGAQTVTRDASDAATSTPAADAAKVAVKHDAPDTDAPHRAAARAPRAAVRGDAAGESAAVTEREERVERETKREEQRDGDADGEQSVIVNRSGRELHLDADHDLVRFDQPAEAMRSYVQKRLPTGMKDLPVERYFVARDKIKQMKQYSTASRRVVPSQVERAAKGQHDGINPEMTGGNAAGVLGTWQNLGPGNVGGRTRALIIDPVTPNTMYAAGVAGGVWKTTNAGASWSPLDDFMPNIAVTVLVFEPGNSNTIYAGTGEGFFNADAVRGAGIFKSTDAGATWTRLASTNTVDFQFVNDVVVSNVNTQHLYAATRSGAWRSLDGGATWAMILNVPTVAPSATGVRGATDLVMRTDQATDYLFVAAGTAFNPGEPASHIYRSTDAANASVVPTGTTPNAGSFTDVYSESGMGRTSLAIAPSNQNVIYAMADSSNAGNYNLGLLGVFRSTSSGDAGTWTTQVRNTSANKQDTLMLSNPVNAVLVECGFGATNQFINQGWYDNVLAVDPTDSNVVWAGGTDLFRSDNGGVNWGVASYWWFQGNGTPPNNGDPQLVHADNHVIVFHPNYNGTTNQTMIVGDDGGIYKTDNAKGGNVGYVSGTTPSGGTVTSSSPICGNEFTPGGFYTVPSPVIWGPLNNGYQVTQFWPGAVYPDGKTYFSGTQDNGTNRGTDAGGSNQWARILGGDGGYAAVDFNNTNLLYAENTGNTFQKSTNGGASFVAARTGISGDTFPFTAVFRMDPNNSARLWYAGRFMWRTDNSAANWTRTSSAQQTGGNISAIAIAPGNSNVVIDGAASGQIRRTYIGTTATTTTPLTGTDPSTAWVQSFTPRGNGFGGISWVEYDPSNTNNVWATVSNFNSASSGNGFGHVFKSADGGATWTLADGNQTPNNLNAIPDIPAHSVAVDPGNGQRIYVGTDLGIFVTLDGGANWYKEITGFGDVPVSSLVLITPTGGTTSFLYAFTHGRSAYRVPISSSCSTATPNGSLNFPAEGGTGTVTVTSSCDWTATNDSGFLAISAPNTGTGNATVTYTVAPNASTSTRSGTIVVAGAVVTITQDAATDNSIVGQVLSGATNAGVNGATVTLSGASSATTTTNAAGGYSFTGLTPGASYTVTPSGNSLTYSPGSKSVASLSGIAVENFVGASGAVSVPAAQGALIISEFRLRGTAGANDEFVEIYNKSGSAVTVTTNDKSLGWAVAASDGAPRFIIPAGVTIPARGHYLAANTGTGGYSLSNYGGTGAATPDITYNTDIPDDSGLTLYSTADPNNFTEAYRLDSVGFTGDANVMAREGVGLAQIGNATTAEFSYVRKLISGSPQDTGDNAQDFVLVSTTGGVINGAQSQLGGPGPENLASIVQRNATVKGSFVDPGCPTTSLNPLTACERVRVVAPDANEPTNSTGGTLKIRRRFTNNTGGTISRLRFRVVDITTLNTPGYTAGGAQADLRVLSSSDSTVTNSVAATVTLKGTTREQSPPTYTLGGGLNTTLSVAIPGGALAPGNTIDVEFNLGVMQGGHFRYFINVEADTSNPASPITSKGGTTNIHKLPTEPSSKQRQ
jgi:hypothetical protein